jgi:nitroreductase
MKPYPGGRHSRSLTSGMDFQHVVRRRRMCRAFEDRPIPPEILDRILANAQRAPSAGFSQGWSFVVLEGREQTDEFWRITSDEDWREDPDWPDMLRAPVVILPLAIKQIYLDRYSEPDKAEAGLQQEAAWSVPYWLVDTAFASMLILLTATDAGLGALFFGIFRGQSELLEALGVPGGYEPIGAIALGWPAPDRPSPSLKRGHRPVDQVIHRGRW